MATDSSEHAVFRKSLPRWAKRHRRVAWLVAALLALAWANGCKRETSGPEAAERATHPPAADAEDATGPSTDGKRDAAPARRLSPPSAEEAEAERRARIAISRDVLGDEPPSRCQSVCDCPPGHSCQPGSDRCIPAMIGTRCCAWDSECPAGQPCVDKDGDPGVCRE